MTIPLSTNVTWHLGPPGCILDLMGKGDDPNLCAVSSKAMDAGPALPAHPQSADMEQLSAQLRHPLSVPAVIPDPEDFRSAHHFRFGEYEILPDPHERSWTARCHFLGQILRRGEKVGYVERHLGHGRDLRLVVAAGRFRLQPEHQGAGLGHAYDQYLFEQYRRMGVARQEATSIEHGCYVWARRGFLFDPCRHDSNEARVMRSESASRPDPEDPAHAGAWHASRLAYYFGWRVGDAVCDGLISEQQGKAFMRRFATATQLAHPTRWQSRFLTPADIAEYGRDEPFTDRGGNTTWLGKHFLLGELDQLYQDGCRGRGMVWNGVRIIGPDT